MCVYPSLGKVYQIGYNTSILRRLRILELLVLRALSLILNSALAGGGGGG